MHVVRGAGDEQTTHLSHSLFVQHTLRIRILNQQHVQLMKSRGKPSNVKNQTVGKKHFIVQFVR